MLSVFTVVGVGSSRGSSFHDFSPRLYEERAVCSLAAKQCFSTQWPGCTQRVLIQANRPARAPRSTASAEFKRPLAQRVRCTTFRDMLRYILLDTLFQSNLLLHRRSFGGARLKWADTDIVPLSDLTASRPLRIDRSPPSRTEREVNVPSRSGTRALRASSEERRVIYRPAGRAEIRAPRSSRRQKEQEKAAGRTTGAIAVFSERGRLPAPLILSRRNVHHTTGRGGRK